jgi:adenylosuccinate synthase
MKSSQSLIVVGLQWGDEGKGKIVDVLSEDFDIVVRFQGGSNAGHTVKIGEKLYKFRIMPTGAIREKKVVIGNGVVVDPIILLDEINALRKAGIKVKLLISDRAHLITPYHIQIDGLNEASKGGKMIGTTRRGIGPTYSDKVARVGVRFCDFRDHTSDQWSSLEASSRSIIEAVHHADVDTQNGASIESFTSAVKSLLPYVGDSGVFLEKEMSAGKRVLFEGAQGTLLDIDHGTYPFVTSSNCISAAASIGTGVPFSKLESVLGICKAYLTRVGTGPFPTEVEGSVGLTIRDKGREYGTVTGRPRRCGWLDIVALRYAVRLNGSKFLAVTKADALTGINPLKICVAYDVDGEETTNFPAGATTLSNVVPIYEELEGWTPDDQSLSDLESLHDLPVQLQRYLAFIEKATNTQVKLVSIGPDRADTIIVS